MLRKLNVGLVGAYGSGYDTKSALNNLKVSVKVLDEIAEKKKFNFYPLTEGVVNPGDAIKVQKKMEDRGVDLLLIQTSSFSPGDIILPLSHTNAWLGLWSVPEPTQEGDYPPLLSLCGMNMYSSIIGHYLKQSNIPFKWFFGMPDTHIFLDRFELTIRVLTALKSLANSKICLVGKNAPGFRDIYFDERFLQTRYKVSIHHSAVSHILRRADQQKKSKVADLVEKIQKEGKNRNVDSEAFNKTARVYLALEELAKENSYDALAIQCWPEFEEIYQLAPCSAIAFLNQNNIVAACEGDVPGALGMLLLNYLSKVPSTLTDLVSFDTEDNSVLMWHCGPTPPCWADERGVEYCTHAAQKRGMVNSMMFAPGDITLVRIIGEGENIFLATARVIGGKRSYNGSRGWLGDIMMEGKKVSAFDFINSVIFHRIPHHFSLAQGNLYDELMEVANWANIEPVQTVPYTRYMQNPKMKTTNHKGENLDYTTRKRNKIFQAF